jgi:uracil-DNA glycosylase family 4
MLNKKQIRMLQLLDGMIEKCRKCADINRDYLVPYWTPYSKYAIINESPTYSNIRNKQHLINNADQILINELNSVGFKARDFLIINSIQCKPNVRPTFTQLSNCKDYIRKYLKIINPEKILCLGNYSKYIFTGNATGVLRERGKFLDGVFEGLNFPVLITVNPGYCLYNEEGKDILREDIKTFKNTKFIRQIEWFLSEDDFKI